MRMSIIVQDSNGTVEGANSYVTLAEFKAYQDDRNGDYSSFTDDEIGYALVKATDYIDQRFCFVGRKTYGRDQTTAWPRVNAWDKDRYYVTGIPQEVKEATYEYAFRALSTTLNPDPDREDSGGLIQSKSEKVGPIEETVEYALGSAFTLPKYPAADQILYKAGIVVSGGTIARG